MGGFQREEYLQRQIKAIAGMLAKIAGLRTRGLVDEARRELEHARQELLGPQADLLRRLDAATAAGMLGSSSRILAYAQLVKEAAALDPDAASAAGLLSRCRELGREAADRAPADERVREFLESLP